MSGLTLQAAFTSGELSPSLSARVDLAKYQQGCRTLLNFKIQPHGGAVKRPGFLLLDELPGEAALIKFAFNKEQTYCLALGEKWMRVFIPDGPVLNDKGEVYQIATPYTLEQARQLSVAQSGDLLFLACWGVAPHKLKRLGHAQWEFEAMSFKAPIKAPSYVSAEMHNEAKKSDGSLSEAQLTTPYTYYVTAADKDGRESELSRGGSITGPASNNWQAGDYIAVSWGGSAGATEYRLYKSSFGGRPGFLATSTSGSYNDYNAAASLSEGAPKYEDPFPSNDYPGVVSFFEQRLIFASTPNRPQTIWMSKSGDYGNFAQYTPVTDDAPLELTIASAEVSSMCWIAALRSLVFGSTSMEWEISSSQGAFTAKTAKATPQSYIGSRQIPSIIVGNTVLHVARSGAQVRDLKYDFGADSYGGTDLTIMASHLLERYHVTGWTYQQHPDSIVWAVRSDGVLLGMTYQPEHQVFAWHRCETQGRFISVCSIPDDHDDALFAVVERNGRIFMESLADEYIDGDYSLAVFLDCAMVYDQPGRKIQTVRGLDHLEGMLVGVLSGGAVEPSKIVTGGSITLEQSSDRVIVGLEYVADLETMPVEIVGQEGSSVGRKKYINSVSIHFHQTANAKVGVTFDRLENVKWRSTENYGDAPRAVSEVKSVTVRSLAENVATVCIRSDTPTPMTILALMPQLDVK
ncbi:hypothetical protein C4J81_17135 [Deltaproteobacteria bacterium Smac51]|nr:hypothetical protein C4J81_17135 [Deltaproteobacteria bacterium Smac51]